LEILLLPNSCSCLCCRNSSLLMSSVMVRCSLGVQSHELINSEYSEGSSDNTFSTSKHSGSFELKSLCISRCSSAHMVRKRATNNVIVSEFSTLDLKND